MYTFGKFLYAFYRHRLLIEQVGLLKLRVFLDKNISYKLRYTRLFRIPLILIASLYCHYAFPQFQNISPTMLSDIESLSQLERRELANQLGILPEGIGINPDFVESKSATNEITSDVNETLYKRIIESEANKVKAKKYRDKNTPIFEKDYMSIEDLPVYGAFLFDGEYSTFAAIENAPVPADYMIGPGDTLRVLMFGVKDSEFTIVVKRDGSINFPELGSFNIAGMTFDKASEYIKSRVSKQMIGIDINISMGRLRTIDVFVAGEARIPGNYSVSALSTVSQLLFVAGGISDIGSLRNIEIKRSNKTIAKFDLYSLLTKGNSEGDIRLQSKDVIFIPVVDKVVYLDGSIKRPGKYELSENESISELIELAGGVKSRAFIKKVYIERYSESSDMPIIINLDLTKNENKNFKLDDGDIVRIAEITDDNTNSIKLIGAVNRPGKYGWHEGLTFSDLITSVSLDFSVNFDINKGLIVRRMNDFNYDIELIDFVVKDAIENKKSNMDPVLLMHDEVYIFSLGHNDDSMNDVLHYDPKIDPFHPMFGKDSENSEIISDNIEKLDNSQNEFSVQENYEMSDLDLEIAIYEAKKQAEFYNLNKGKRRELLGPIIDKLQQQATTSDSIKIVSISGAVKIPGKYPLIKNSSYMDLIDLAGGFRDDAYTDSAELRRATLDDSGLSKVETIDLDLNDLMNEKLFSRDHLHIRGLKDWDTRDSVILSGEVFYPGEYLISPNEKLSSVIKRAGGFTNESFVSGAVFTRESIKQKEREQLQILGDTIRRDQAARSMTKESEDFSVSSAEVEAGIEALLSSEVYGRLIIDISQIMEGDDSADIVLQDGDNLSIPKYTNAVTVVGEVRRSGSFVRQDSYDLDDYLNLAAGMTARGDSDEIYIIKADGSVKKNISRKSFLKFEDYSTHGIHAGDTIVVPIKSSYQTPLNLYSTVSQVVFQSIASIAAFSTVFD